MNGAIQSQSTPSRTTRYKESTRDLHLFDITYICSKVVQLFCYNFHLSHEKYSNVNRACPAVKTFYTANVYLIHISLVYVYTIPLPTAQS